jgi:transcriptional regulator with XRE-family HTH domain
MLTVYIMKDRIIQFLKENNLTSTKFADAIGVQRSSISHILSGRNKPSYDFIEKMLLSYPEINAQWLITGKGNMFLNQPSLFKNDEKIPENILTPSESHIQNSISHNTEIKETEEEKEIIPKTANFDSEKKKIERVLIFYENGTFREFIPE